jgi:hypothetical protein
MSRKLIMAQPPFTMLVANLRRGSDPSRGPAGNPDPVRQTYTHQLFPELGGRGPDVGTPDPRSPGVSTHIGHVDYTTAPIPVAATGTITVAADTWTGPTTVHIGQYVLTSDVDFVTGGGVNATATNLAAAIDALPGYSAPAPGAAIITVTGPFGVQGNEVAFYADGSTPQNLTFVPADDTLEGAEPTLGPVILG